MRLGCLAFCLAIYLLWAGGQGLYEAAINRTPHVMTQTAFCTAKPHEGWFKITHCTLDVLDGCWKKTSSDDTNIETAFIPIYSDTDSSLTSTPLLLATQDEKILATMTEMSRLDKEGNDASIKAWLEQNKGNLMITRDVQGMIAYGVNSDDKINAKLAELTKTPEADLIIMDDGGTPSLGLSLLKLVGGLAILAVMGISSLGKHLPTNKVTPTIQPEQQTN